MHLVDPLAAGVRGAENGRAQLFVRGGSTRASWFASFEADGENDTGADITLDANGGAVVYVNEYVDVRVYASTENGGALVREFVAGSNASAIEVISPSFTGTDYDSVAIGVNKPVDLQEVLRRWTDSAGAPDWEVDLGGQTVTIMQAIAGNIVVNVKSPPYNAAGDGTTDDTASINAAILFANSLGGGIVYFPPGTYLISATLTLLENVSMLGVPSAGTSIIERDTSSFSFITTSDSSSFIRHLTFQDADTGTNQPYFDVDVTDVLHLEYCVVQAPLTSTTNGAPVFNDDCGGVRLRWCQVTLQGPNGRLATRTGAALVRDTIMIGTSLTWDGDNNYASFGIIGITRMFDCQINYTTDSTPPTGLIQPYAGSALVGNMFLASTTAVSITAFYLDGANGAGTVNGIVESGNQFDDKFRDFTTASGSMLSMSQPQRTRDYTVATGAAVTILAEFGNANVVTSGGAGAVTLDFSNSGENNSNLIFIVVRNPTGSNHTITTSGTSPVDAGVALNAGQVARVIYRRATVGGTTAWFRMTAFTVTAI